MARKKASKKKASKKVAAKATTHVKSKGSTSKEVLVNAPDDADQEPVAAPAHEAEPMCYTRGRGQTKHMTVAAHNRLRGK